MKPIELIPHKLEGTIQVPTSKSLAHRAIICASLAKGISKIYHVSMSRDIQATIECMQALGTRIKQEGSTLIIDGTHTFTMTQSEMNCGESGSTLRFLVPVSLVNSRRVHFFGEGKLGERPLKVFYDIFDKQQIDYHYVDKKLDLNIQGQLLPDSFEIPGNISSQFISGLFFALPLLKQDSTIKITTSLESRGYIDLTLNVLETFGIHVINHNYELFEIPGNQVYQPHDYEVEADFSQAAFYLVAGAIGNDITITNLNLESAQGDKAVIDILEAMGAMLVHTTEGYKMIASQLSSTTIDASQCPDIIPVVTLACALASGTSEIINAGRLRIKECDRLSASCELLKKNGVEVTEEAESMIIVGTNNFKGVNVSSYNDHRMAMTEAIMATRCENGFTIDDKNCVAKSYPHFFEDYKMLGGQYHEC